MTKCPWCGSTNITYKQADEYVCDCETIIWLDEQGAVKAYDNTWAVFKAIKTLEKLDLISDIRSRYGQPRGRS